MVQLEDGNLTALVEALDHGRDGHPRWVVAAVRRSIFTDTAESIANAASARGYIALPVGDYVRERILDPRQFDERTLLLLDTRGDPARAHSALLQAASQSARPHLLLTLRTTYAAANIRVVREARAAYAAQTVTRQTPQVAELVARASRASEFIGAGRHAAAERLLRDVAAALERRDAAEAAARITMQLARALLDRGRMNTAFETFGAAAVLAQSASVDSVVIESRLWQATAHIADAALVEAEAICRAVLEAPRLDGPMRVWAQSLLAESLYWRGQFSEAPDRSDEDERRLAPVVRASIEEVRVRCLLAGGNIFEAGRTVERLAANARESNEASVRVAACQADLEVLAATGDLMRSEEAFGLALAASRAARLAIRTAWSRLVWMDALRRAGRTEAAAPQLARLKRFARVAPLLLRREIDRRLSPDAPPLRITIAAVHSRPSSLVLALLRVAHEEDDDEAAVRRLASRVGGELQVSRIDVLSAAAGPPTIICSAGEGLPTRLGPRVLEAGFAIGPERQASGSEIGVPVRFGARAPAAVVGRWPVDRVVPIDAAELLELVAVIAAPRLDALLSRRHEEAKAATAVAELLGASEAIANVRKAIVRAAAAPFAVLIEGESGVGKELAARAVHQLSARRERKFCDVNCAALPEELLESELFGHARGAFSGAVSDRAGLFEEADGGTLLLDEVADLSGRAQAKLLRAIQQQEVRRVGESFTRKVDVRIIAAANRDMRAEAAAGRFRHDLLYRLDVVRIHIPPLRDRPADIPILAERCWETATRRTGSNARLSPATLSELARYHWPGNVRELQNVIASLAVAAPPRGWVRPAVLPSAVGTATTVCAGRLAEAREQFERRFVEVALARAGNRTQAARALGLSRQGLLKTLVRLGLGPANR